MSIPQTVVFAAGFTAIILMAGDPLIANIRDVAAYLKRYGRGKRN
jgi:hypothetical protein